MLRYVAKERGRENLITVFADRSHSLALETRPDLSGALKMFQQNVRALSDVRFLER